jgi:phytoene dehydrogenase-like protein
VSAKPVVVVGAGLAGLCCARTLVRNGVDVVLLEAQNDVGGRVRTDVVDGFRLDRGFQVLQTAYPEARQQLDYSTLHLKNFEPGALIRTGNHTVRMSDPWRRPLQLFSTAFNEIGVLSDRWKLAKLRWHVSNVPLEDLWSEPDSSTYDYLLSTCQFSTDMIERFFRPWLSGVFLEHDLATSSRFFKFVFRMFSIGDAAIPEQGMGVISKQLAEEIPVEMRRLSTRVDSLNGTAVRLKGGETLDTRAIVLAVEGPEASRLSAGLIAATEFRSTTCFYFAAAQSPMSEPLLVLDGGATGPINHLAVLTNIAPSYAPPGQSLVSVSVIGQDANASTELELDVRRQLRDWYGSQVDRWLTLPSYYIRHALPGKPLRLQDGISRSPRVGDGLYRCGDYCETASIHGAMVSGRCAAESVLSDLGLRNA